MRLHCISSAIHNLPNAASSVVAAAGNDGTDEYEYPAAYSSVLSVAAVSRSKSRASFSQMNDMVEMAAPGVDILSTYSGGAYSYQSGTSST